MVTNLPIFQLWKGEIKHHLKLYGIINMSIWIFFPDSNIVHKVGDHFDKQFNFKMDLDIIVCMFSWLSWIQVTYASFILSTASIQYTLLVGKISINTRFTSGHEMLNRMRALEISSISISSVTITFGSCLNLGYMFLSLV